MTKQDCSRMGEQCRAANLTPLMKQVQDIKIETKEIKENLESYREDSRQFREAMILDLALLPQKLSEELDKKYASKLVEKIVYSLVGIILTAVFMALIGLVIIR